MLRDDSRSAAGSRRRDRVRGALVIVQVAGFCGWSCSSPRACSSAFSSTSPRKSMFDSTGTLTMTTYLPQARYPHQEHEGCVLQECAAQ